MKRVGNLWDKLTGWENLMEATRVAARGKRQRPDGALGNLAGNPARRPALQLVEPPEKAAAATIGRPTKKSMRYWAKPPVPPLFRSTVTSTSDPSTARIRLSDGRDPETTSEGAGRCVHARREPECGTR
jgi:hypothetical protein